ncbi:hypothetical protein M0R04_00320 [Candidatus Dojkabacteria bacterium]|jgi:hypothetical protein|nr:hypothetical protein [Candidatus Dojkabacteria bacterium]
MEKAIVFLPMILLGGFFLLLIVLFIVVVIVIIAKGKAQTWKGVITEKISNTSRGSFEDSDKVSQLYSLAITLDGGKNVKIAVSKQLYDSLKVGDRLFKEKGSSWPVKI